MNTFAVTALSPLDGRYANKLQALQMLMSEHGFMQRRVQVEVAWFIALSDEVNGVQRSAGCHGVQRRGQVALMAVRHGPAP